MSLFNKKGKVFGTLAMTAVLATTLGTNILADSVTIQRKDDTCKYKSGEAYTNFAYYLNGKRAYSYVPGGEANYGAEYNMTGKGDARISWIASNVLSLYDEQVAQAAIWKINGANVEAINGNTMQPVDELISRATDALRLQTDSSSVFTTAGAEIFYDTGRDEYISSPFGIGKYETLSIAEIEGSQNSIERPYFEKYDPSRGFERVYTSTITDVGSYRFVIPRKCITKRVEVDVVYSIEGTTYRQADVWTSATDTQSLVTEAWGKMSSIYPVSFASISDIYLTGDMNHDTYLNSTDAALVLDCFKNNNATKLDYNIGDMNKDNQLNASDAAMIIDMFKDKI